MSHTGLIAFGRYDRTGYLGATPPVRMRGFSGPRDTIDAMTRAAHGPRGEQSIVVRRFTEEVVRFIWPKDYVGEIQALRNVFLQVSPYTGVPLVRYTNDPRHVELVKDPQRIVEEISTHGSSTCDCDESALLLATMLLQLGRETQFVGLGFTNSQHLTHVAVRTKEPKSGRWFFIDTVAGPREREAAVRAQAKLFYSLD